MSATHVYGKCEANRHGSPHIDSFNGDVEKAARKATPLQTQKLNVTRKRTISMDVQRRAQIGATVHAALR